MKITAASLLAWSVYVCMFQVFQCQPVAQSWESAGVGSCVDEGTFIEFSVPNSGLDVSRAWSWSPLHMLHPVQVKTATKWKLHGLFSLGES